MTEVSAKTKRAKEAASKRPQTWKPGESGNPKGAPKRGGSMAEAYEWAMSLRPEEVVEILTLNGSNDLARQYKQMPQGVQIKLLVALRIVASVMFEPTPGLANHVVDRTDGPVKQVIEGGDPSRPIIVKASQISDDDLASLIAGLTTGSSDRTTDAPSSAE